MAELMTVSVISPERVLYEGSARSVTAPAHDGEVGILSGHAPLMTLLGEGMLRLGTESGEVRFEVKRGFLQVVDDQIRIVTEHAEALT